MASNKAEFSAHIEEYRLVFSNEQSSTTSNYEEEQGNSLSTLKCTKLVQGASDDDPCAIHAIVNDLEVTLSLNSMSNQQKEFDEDEENWNKSRPAWYVALWLSVIFSLVTIIVMITTIYHLISIQEIFSSGCPSKTDVKLNATLMTKIINY